MEKICCDNADEELNHCPPHPNLTSPRHIYMCSYGPKVFDMKGKEQKTHLTPHKLFSFKYGSSCESSRRITVLPPSILSGNSKSSHSECVVFLLSSLPESAKN